MNLGYCMQVSDASGARTLTLSAEHIYYYIYKGQDVFL